MLKPVFIFVLLAHGLIHLLGFIKAFNYAEISRLTQGISKPIGILWLVTTLLFLISLILFFLGNEGWWKVAAIGIILSQILIVLSWQDAKFGTIANVIILIAVGLSWGKWQFENKYRNDIKDNLARTSELKTELLMEKDLDNLPEPVKRYLIYSNVLNKPKVHNVKIVFEGEMRDKEKHFTFTSEQYNFFDEPTRLFFMKGKMFGITVPGYHRYSFANATMDIRLFGLFPVARHSGPFMNKTETVTLFNDMCLMAPATLIDKKIKWELIDNNSVKAVFSNRGITISAVLYFNDLGQLTNFKSNDRTAISEMKQFPFSTPVYEYKNLNGINVMSRGDAVWHYPKDDFIYGKFTLKDIKYNIGDHLLK